MAAAAAAAAEAAPTIDRIFRERFHFEERLHYKAYRLILITDSTESSEILMTAIVRQLINEAHNTSYLTAGVHSVYRFNFLLPRCTTNGP